MPKTEAIKKACAQAVYNKFISFGKIRRVISKPETRANFVPNLWVNPSIYSQLFRKLITMKVSVFTPVVDWVVPIKHIANNYILLINNILIRRAA